MSTLDERHTADWLQRERALGKDVIAERAASQNSDELRSIGSFSVLSEPDRQIVAAVRRWIRHMWLEATPGYSMTLDGIDHDSVFEVLKQIDDLYARTSTEPGISRGRTSV